MKDALTFGGWLKRRRGGLGLTQRELAAQIGYAEVTLRKVEADELRPSRQMVDKLAEALQIRATEQEHFVRFARHESSSGGTAAAWQELPDLPLESAPQSPTTVIEYTLVGRQEAWHRLRSTWASAMQPAAHFVCIAGEAGIGKTRLAEELLRHAQQEGHATARARAYSLEGRLAYAPLADWLRTPPLQANLAELNSIWLSEAARLLPELLIAHPDLPSPEPLTERWRQKRFFDALRHAFTTPSRPLLLLLDDLQWCDAETLAWLQYLFYIAPEAPLLVVGTVRSDEVQEDHPWHNLRRALLRDGKLSTIDLLSLSAAETTALAAQVREYALDSWAANRLYQTTAGNPLFVIETARAGDNFTGLHADAGKPRGQATFPQPDMALPAKVYAVIDSRLAQLSPTAHTLTQIAAIIGRSFTLALLREASHLDEEAVVAGADELWQRRIVAEQAEGHYDFTHDRIRDVAYAAGSPILRAHFHRQVAQALAKLYAANLDSLAGELAVHYQRAGAWEEAFTYFRRAADVAQQLYAHRERVDYLEKAISVTQKLPADLKMTTTEMDLWSELAQALVLVHDWSSELVAAAWRKVDELAEQAGNLRYRCRALGSLTTVYRRRGDWRKARELNELVVTLGAKTGDALYSESLFADYGITLHQMGEFAEALACFRRHPAHSPTPAQLVFASDSAISPGGFLRAAMCLWSLGFPDQALVYGRHFLTIRHEHIDFIGRFPGLTFASMLFTLLRHTPTVRMLGEELAASSAKYDWPLFTPIGRIFAGWAMAQQGAVQDGLALIQSSIDEERRRGIRLLEPYNRSLLAETLALAGDFEYALDEVTAALAYAEECGNCFWNAQLLKLQGDYRQMLSLPVSEAEACYQRAIAVAQRQGAKSLELRATISLCRLWQRQDRQVEAHQALAAIYGWFTEGFDTIDLREAKALLDGL